MAWNRRAVCPVYAHNYTRKAHSCAYRGRWSAIAVLISLVAVFVTGGALGALVVLVIGIHADERRKTLKGKAPAGTRLEAGTRRVLGVGVRNVAVPDDRPDRNDVRR